MFTQLRETCHGIMTQSIYLFDLWYPMAIIIAIWKAYIDQYGQYIRHRKVYTTFTVVCIICTRWYTISTLGPLKIVCPLACPDQWIPQVHLGTAWILRTCSWGTWNPVSISSSKDFHNPLPPLNLTDKMQHPDYLLTQHSKFYNRLSALWLPRSWSSDH